DTVGRERTDMTDVLGTTVCLRSLMRVVAHDRTVVSAALAGADDIYCFAGREDIHLHLIADIDFELAVAHFSHEALRCGIRFFRMSDVRLGGTLFLHVLKAELNSFISVIFHGLFCRTMFGVASTTVTGIITPSSVKTWVIPNLRPKIPFMLCTSIKA